MAKKPVQFRFEENFHKELSNISTETGQSVSEIVRNAISLYMTIYSRTRGGGVRFFIQEKDSKTPHEVILPWLQS